MGPWRAAGVSRLVALPPAGSRRPLANGSPVLAARPGGLLVAPSAFAQVAAQKLRTQRGTAPRRHQLAGQHAGDDLGLPLVFRPKPHGPGMKDLGSTGLQEVPV